MVLVKFDFEICAFMRLFFYHYFKQKSALRRKFFSNCKQNRLFKQKRGKKGDRLNSIKNESY